MGGKSEGAIPLHLLADLLCDHIRQARLERLIHERPDLNRLVPGRHPVAWSQRIPGAADQPEGHNRTERQQEPAAQVHITLQGLSI
ncbi:hypothetical protein SDC9_209203 [bioreactor metagenome]|uniref:Uncharacterized protein n=1 Tax=bioreactor metagenome TaxID=1076179 RepID=A0A645JDC9_9ZZZZ